MKTKQFIVLFGILLSLLPHLSEANDKLPPHKGKCGKLTSSNMGDAMNQCKVGDVVIVQRKVVPMYCDYRYSIHKYDGKGAGSTFSCILRVTRKNRKRS